jgi:hypothetical protein
MWFCIILKRITLVRTIWASQRGVVVVVLVVVEEEEKVVVVMVVEVVEEEEEEEEEVVVVVIVVVVVVTLVVVKTRMRMEKNGGAVVRQFSERGPSIPAAAQFKTKHLPPSTPPLSCRLTSPSSPPLLSAATKTWKVISASAAWQ